MLPKIHKKGVPGRPICSLVNHPTSRLSKLVDEHIKEYVPKTKSYIRDTQDFIRKIKDLGPIPEGAILCTLDVSSLYTNIPNNEGILAVALKLRSDPSKTPIASFILDLLKLVLHSMNFTFNGDHYLQTGGTAMGTFLAPNYANLFMDRFETKALAGFPLKPLTWKRFIDDCFMVWTHGEESLKTFIEYLNSLHPTIKFTHERATLTLTSLTQLSNLTQTEGSSQPYSISLQTLICIWNTAQPIPKVSSPKDHMASTLDSEGFALWTVTLRQTPKKSLVSTLIEGTHSKASKGITIGLGNLIRMNYFKQSQKKQRTHQLGSFSSIQGTQKLGP